MTDAEDDETLSRALNAVSQWSNTKGEILLRKVAPIYSEGPRTPLLLGSGTLIRLGELVFLLSAAHVADDASTGPHTFGAGGVLLPLPPFRQVSPLPASGRREDDRFDLAHWVLDPQSAAGVPSADTVFPAELDFGAIAADLRVPQFLVQGYPGSRQPRDFDGVEWQAKPFKFLTDERPADAYSAAGLDREQNLFLDFEKRDVHRAGERIEGPNLHGVSGGAIWRLSGAGASASTPLLSGVVIGWRRRQVPGIIATRLHKWISWVASEYPEARRALGEGRQLQRGRLT